MNLGIRRLLLRLVPTGLLGLCLGVAAAPSPDIRIEGGTSALRDNIRQYLTLADEPCAAPLWRLNSLLLDAQPEIQDAAQALGYYQLTYSSSLTQADSCWQLALRLDAGEPVKVTELTLEITGSGATDAIFQPLRDSPEIKLGDSLNHGRYENLKSRIQSQATGHGYFDGHFDRASILVDPAAHSAKIELIFATEARYRLGEIRMAHRILDEDFLRLYLNIAPGDYYDTDKLLELKSFYNASNYFSLASASPDLPHLHDDLVDIDVQLEERKRYAYSLGAGVSTDTGPRLLLGFEDRYINAAGHSLKADISTSSIKTTAQVAYTVPLSKPSYEFLKVYAGLEKEQTDMLYSDKDTLGVSYTYYQHNQWLRTYGLNIEHETSRLGGQDFYSQLRIPSVSFARTQTDGSPYPLRGWNALARLSLASTALGADIDYQQFYLRGKYIYGAGFGRLLLRSELGATRVADFARLPSSLRYFAGGGGSVRGYDYKSLGPSHNQQVIGGKNLWVTSLEYDYQVRPNWAVASFFDMGNAANDFNFQAKRGAGLGLRWISPIGPVRIDLAQALDAPKGWNLHISMGPDL